MLSPASAALRRRIYAELELKARSDAWVTIDPESPKGRAAIDRLVAGRDAGRLVVGSATLTEDIDWDLAARSEWSLLSTKYVDDFNLWDDYPGCRAGTLPKVHALNGTFVSSAFVKVCRERRLRGAAFLQCEHRGRKAGLPWFVALPAFSIGRGLDHPWFDRGRWLRDVVDSPGRRTSAIDMGQSQFHQCWLRADARDDVLDAVLRLCPADRFPTSGIYGLQFVTIPRYWAGALPRADLAYLPWGEDGPNRAGKLLRFRRLAVSARAREALTGAGLFDRRSFLPVTIVRDLPPHQALLDREHDPIPPMYSASELEALRARERLLTLPRST